MCWKFSAMDVRQKQFIQTLLTQDQIYLKRTAHTLSKRTYDSSPLSNNILLFPFVQV